MDKWNKHLVDETRHKLDVLYECNGDDSCIDEIFESYLEAYNGDPFRAADIIGVEYSRGKVFEENMNPFNLIVYKKYREMEKVSDTIKQEKLEIPAGKYNTKCEQRLEDGTICGKPGYIRQVQRRGADEAATDYFVCILGHQRKVS